MTPERLWEYAGVVFAIAVIAAMWFPLLKRMALQ